MHGYHPEDPHSDAIFLSSCRPSITMHTIADVFSCMQKAAGLDSEVPGSERQLRSVTATQKDEPTGQA
jgi:hypothetical protein